ncbi:C4-dicarboxylate ABC transporter permease [Thioclava sp. SK-1]|uniref:TRAP transporter small permease subunit n=1 Tax=Thioclava sp. SK-1 TaxID=1889770 RepID=UPI0008251220|nr:TRAP transporter small permease subunit [Thioclava sp. SK-1]OCX67252.1 C4-dicarboxylate ABC transporter permease [Thioclava sp. SK-1]
MVRMMQGYTRVLDKISDCVGIVSMYLIFLMVAVLLLDAVTRNVLDIPLHWCIEFAQFTLAAYYFMGGPKTLKDGEHVRMDLLYEKLSWRGKHRLDLIMSLCLLFYLGVLLWGSVSSLEYAIKTGERRFSMWNPSMIPIKALMVGCIILMVLQTISEMFKHVLALRGKTTEGTA